MFLWRKRPGRGRSETMEEDTQEQTEAEASEGAPEDLAGPGEELTSEFNLKKSTFEFAKNVVWFLLLYFALTSWVVQGYEIEGGSMEDTLLDGERLLVNKLGYKLGGEIERGDVIVFKYPLNPRRPFIKRVIGLQGDKIEIRRNDGVYVNGERLDEDYLPPGETTEPRTHPARGEEVVPEGKFFVMGDHRSVSVDSRSRTLGYLDKEYVLGKAFVRFWPLTKISRI